MKTGPQKQEGLFPPVFAKLQGQSYFPFRTTKPQIASKIAELEGEVGFSSSVPVEKFEKD
ncbi:MAG: hypothetical protein WB561_01805 [Terracidiphilus sp.]